MKKKISLIAFLLFSAIESEAQLLQFDWGYHVGNTGHTVGNSISADDNGFLYAGGTFEGIINYDTASFNCGTGSDGYLFKLDTSGNLIWSKQFSGYYDVNVRSVIVDHVKDIIVIGDYKNYVDAGVPLYTNHVDTVISTNMFIVKYDTNGNLLWVKNTCGKSYTSSVTVDENNNILIAGQCADIALFDTSISIHPLDSAWRTFPTPGWYTYQPVIGFIVKYDSNGNKIWIRETDGLPKNIISDHNNEVIVTGWYPSQLTMFDGNPINPHGTDNAYLAKYDSGGSIIWLRSSGGTANWNSGYGLEVDSLGFIYQSGDVCGNYILFGGSVVAYHACTEAFLAKYSSNGTPMWYVIIGDTTPTANPDFNRGNSLALTENGNILLIGYFKNDLHFGALVLQSLGAYDLMMIRFDTSGNVITAGEYYHIGWVGGNDLDVIGDDIFITGYTSLTWMNSNEPLYAIIAKVSESSINAINFIEPVESRIFPNPFTESAVLEFKQDVKNVDIVISDPSGKMLRQMHFSGRTCRIEKQDLNPGIYFISVNGKEKNIIWNHKLVVQN